jgi:hypothetical protein
MMRHIHIPTLACACALSCGLSHAEIPKPVREPATLRQIDAAITLGVDFLIARQNKNGSWGGPTRTKGLNIYAPLPGAHHAFRAGATGLALSGLIEARDQRPEAQAATTRAADWISSELPKLRRADTTTTYNVWGHAYGLRALTRLHRIATDDASRKQWTELAHQQIGLANRYEDINGGWGYLDLFDEIATRRPSGLPTSFTTATLLLAMAEARDAMGVKLNEQVITRSLNALRMQRNPDFTYAYSFPHRMRPRGDINRPAGSLSRSQVCNAALRVFNDDRITDAVLTTWADRFLAREGFLDMTRKRPIPHEGPFKIAGYFYYYGVYYLTESVRHLPKEKHPHYATQLATLLVALQEKDGSWWDYPLYDYHQPYGTGYALMSLAWCRDVLSSSAEETSGP